MVVILLLLTVGLIRLLLLRRGVVGGAAGPWVVSGAPKRHGAPEVDARLVECPGIATIPACRWPSDPVASSLRAPWK